jgi:hypothetical protein
MGCARAIRKKGISVKIVDLGDFDDPLLLFGGAHTNLQAFQALSSGIWPSQVVLPVSMRRI